MPRLKSPRAAPGDLAHVQAFLDSGAAASDDDAFATVEGASRWLAARDLLAPGTPVSEAGRQRAIVVREGLRAIAASHGDAALDTAAVRRLAEACLRSRFRLDFADDGSTRLRSVSEDLDSVLERLLGAVAAGEADGTWGRVKVCANPACGRVFYDTARNRRRRWCVEVCGELLRSRAHRGSRLAGRSVRGRRRT